VSDELDIYASASPRRRRIMRAANTSRGARSAGFQAVGYRNPISNLPKGAKLSPEADLGLLSQKEALAVAQWKQRPGKPEAASEYIPVKKGKR
jgi:hypothetical protein